MSIARAQADLLLDRQRPAVRPLLEHAGRLLPALLLVLLVAAPLLAVFAFLLEPSEGIWAHLAQTVLGEYLRNTLLLCLGVAALAGGAGAGSAWLVTMYRFPGQRFFNWALMLPLAMPAYVLAYAYTDFLQVTGPLQTMLRDLTGWGWQDYWFPNIRSLGGAVFVLGAVLYPYVYLMARAAFLEQSQCALEVSRTLGCTPLASFRRVGLPLARPAIAAGIAFVLMETLADFGAVSYFEVRTFTTGIYRAWYALGSPAAAAQLGSILLLFVFGVLAFERLSRGRARFTTNTTHIHPKQSPRLTGARGLLASLACALPILLGFGLPALLLAWMAVDTGEGIGLGRLGTLAGNTLLLGALASVLIVLLAIGGLASSTFQRGRAARKLLRVAALGYAAPGAVIGVGILVSVGGFDRAVDSASQALFGIPTGLVLGGTIGAVLYGYLIRFFAVAYNPLEAGLAKVTPNLEDAARVLGCGTPGLLARVHLPLLRTSVLAALLFVFVDVMKELPATLILRPFNFDTLAVEAFRLATTERLDAAALPSLLIVAAGLLPVILLCRMLDRGTGARRA
ncbi:ABC transporter permease [Marinimicrococcus flavescens]|uniref:Iron ABC transporter permease n=1 Tax=Marinimicrococcus flavescens TaxID=3031815 RepID=A0AAP3XQR6_9PROT|nr:iron ABC transporter permease [Marinimicrococcus flavescens]